MTRTALLAAVVSAALLPLSAFAHGGGHGGGGGGGGHAGGHAGGSHASSHPVAHASSHPHPHPHHHAGGPGGSSHAAKPSLGVTNASLATAARPANHPGTNRSQFAKDHPRRHEVNHRDRDQLARIREGLKSGKLTPTQAKQLLANDKSIKQQERADVKANGGYLTKSEQRQFNREENANSRLIRDEKHPASAATPAVAKPAVATSTVATASRPGNPIGARAVALPSIIPVAKRSIAVSAISGLASKRECEAAS